jgi:hypothetical protein
MELYTIRLWVDVFKFYDVRATRFMSLLYILDE